VPRAFIVRPFGEKKFGKEQIPVNFDEVERSLIDPALKHLNIDGRTTAEILESGNIRDDMFQLLVASDLVIADLTVHNANVFYELGVRHALREKRTFLLYSNIGNEDVPFDLRTDRYLAYDHKAPDKSVPALIDGLQRTLASEDKDSPIFRMLPALRSQDPGRFMVVPADFQEEVRAAADKDRAGVLALMADEVAGLLWEREGLRLVARAQCERNLHAAATETWERVLRQDPGDWEANLELGSIYHGAAELEKSNQCLKRVLESSLAEPAQRAEAHALRARNAVAFWRRTIERTKPEEKAAAALESPRLEESYDEFRQAFEEDLRSYRFGVDAMARLTVWIALAERLAQVWEDAHDTPEQAAADLKAARSKLARLAAAVDLSIEIAKPQAAEKMDLRIVRAELTLLTSTRPERVKAAYVSAAEYASPADLAQLGRFLEGFADVDVLSANVAAAATVLGARMPAGPGGGATPPRALLYRGYGPELLGCENAVRDWIRARIEAEAAAAGGVSNLTAVAGGGCGGDILFHEVCRELKVTSHVYAPYTQSQYIARFVQCHDPQWVERFTNVVTTQQFSFLQPSPEMPKWLKDRKGYGCLERWNSWMVAVARCAAPQVTLLAICDENRIDEEGVWDLVRKARQTGVKPVIANPEVFHAG